MSGSDTESVDISTDTDSDKRVGTKKSATARGTGQQKSIYDKHSVCLDELLKPNRNKAFSKLYRDEVNIGKRYFTVPMFEHGRESDGSICGLPDAVWSVVNARTKHYNDQHGGENKPKSNEGVIWACLKPDQPTSQPIRFFDGQGKPSLRCIQAALDVSDAQSESVSSETDAESQSADEASDQAEPVEPQIEAQPAEPQLETEPAEPQIEAEPEEPQIDTHQAEPQTEAEPQIEARQVTEAQQTEPLFSDDWNHFNTLLDEFDPGQDEQLNGHDQEMVSPMEQDPLMSEDDEKDVVRSFDIALRKRERKVANARSEVESLSKKHQKLEQKQQERQRTKEQTAQESQQLSREIQEATQEIARLQREVEVRKERLLHLKAESADETATFQQKQTDIRAKQATAEANLQTQQEDLLRWSHLHTLLHDTLNTNK